MKFEDHLIEYNPSTDQIQSQLKEMKKLMDGKAIPKKLLSVRAVNICMQESIFLKLKI